MAEKVKFQPQTFDINSINNGNRFGYDGIQPEAVNAPIEAAAYVQSLATNQPNVENANKVGVPTVSIELAPNGTPRFKFEELKGKDHSQEISAINSNITAIREEQVEQNEQIESNRKEVHNIKQALLQNEVLVVSKIPNKTTTRVTAGGENIVDDQYTAVTEIKGSTVKDENLIPYPYKYGTTTINGVSFFVSDTGVVACNGTATSRAVYSLGDYHDYGKTLYLSGAPVGGDTNTTFSLRCFSHPSGAWAGNDVGNGTVIRTVSGDSSYYFAIIIEAGFTCNNLVFKPMLNEGTIAKKWTPRFSDLKHAHINSIKSTGRNLFDKSKATIGWGLAISTGGLYQNAELFSSDYIPVDGVTPFTINWETPKWVLHYDKDKNYLGNGDSYKENSCYIRFTANLSEIDTIQLEYGTQSTEYRPYTEEFYQLPETLELGEWDSFNPQTGELVRATKEIVITGEEPRWRLSDAGTSEERFGHDGLASGAVSGSYRISNKDVFGVTKIEVYPSGWVDIYDTRYKSVEEWTNYLKSLNAAGTPLRIAYKLATPTTETIANVPKTYKAYNHGSETVNQGETDNSKFGAMPTITNEYILKIGGETE